MPELKEGISVLVENFKEPVGGGKRDRHPCRPPADEHDWECSKTGCKDCWDPECVENARKEQENYDTKQSKADKTPDEKVAEFKSHADSEISAGKDRIGLDFEKDTLDKVGSSRIENYSYKAHCSKCHSQAELDIVTNDSVIECKNSAKGFKLDQIKSNIKPIADKCFPGKKLVFATRSSEVDRLQKKLAQWKNQGHISEFTILGV